MVIARTIDGDIGILANHAPLLSVLVAEHGRDPDGLRRRTGGRRDPGFISVANNRISMLAEHAELADDIDVDRARRELEQAEGTDRSDERQLVAAREAQARIRAVEKAT